MIQSQSDARVLLGRVEDLAGTAADGVDEDVDLAEPLERLRDHPIAVGLDSSRPP